MGLVQKRINSTSNWIELAKRSTLTQVWFPKLSSANKKGPGSELILTDIDKTEMNCAQFHEAWAKKFA